MDALTFDICDNIVKSVSKKIARKVPWRVIGYTFSSIQDIEQQGWVCLLDSEDILELAEVNPIENGKLIYTAIYCDLLDHIRSVCGRPNANGKESLPAKTRGIFNTSSTDEDHTRDEEKIFTAFLSKEIAEFMNRKVSIRHNYVARLYFADGLNQKEIGRKLGITESRVSQILTGVTETVQRHYNQ